MGIKDRFIGALGLMTEAQLNEMTTRAYEQGYFDGGNDEPPSGDIKSYGYRRTTGGLRDFTKLSHDQLIEIVWTLYQSNPIAKRYLVLKRAFILGRGINIQADNDDLQIVLDDFRGANDFDARLKKFVLQLFLWGEQCFPAFVRQSDGAASLGYMDPAEIETVIPHPENAMEAWMVVCKARDTDREKRIYRIIREDKGVIAGGKAIPPKYPGRLVVAEQPGLEEWELMALKAHGLNEYTGSCFYFTINNVSNQPRGFSDLLQVADWLDSHDETLFALADREAFAGYFSWDVTLTGVSDTQVRARANEIRSRPPRRGSVNVHNDTETWRFDYPDLKQPGSIASAEAIEVHALGGLGMPRHWYGHGNETNRATAQAQGEPTQRSLQDDQDAVRDMVLFICRFVMDQAIIAGKLNLPEDEGVISIIMPEMTSRDVTAIAGALGQVVQAMVIAVDTLKILTRKTAAQAINKVLAELGIEYDPVAELEEIDEAEEKVSQDIFDTADTVNEWLAERIENNGSRPAY